MRKSLHFSRSLENRFSWTTNCARWKRIKPFIRFNHHSPELWVNGKLESAIPSRSARNSARLLRASQRLQNSLMQRQKNHPKLKLYRQPSRLQRLVTEGDTSATTISSRRSLRLLRANSIALFLPTSKSMRAGTQFKKRGRH